SEQPQPPVESEMLEQGVHRLGGYLEQAPPPDLEAMVSAVWAYLRPAAGVSPIPGAGHRVLPEAGVSLCRLSRREGDGRTQEPGPDGGFKPAGRLVRNPLAIRVPEGEFDEGRHHRGGTAPAARPTWLSAPPAPPRRRPPSRSLR
ncbi:MAG TPA: hypothetical protein VFS20_16035, partial [Longimicrobium sp.]|nr:hypothetical protein [Longimicrobium sp.]